MLIYRWLILSVGVLFIWEKILGTGGGLPGIEVVGVYLLKRGDAAEL